MATHDAPSHPYALVVDWGGVLTTSLVESMAVWAAQEAVDTDVFREVLRGWLRPATGEVAHSNPIFALERGEIEVGQFERELAARMRASTGATVATEGLVGRMFEHLHHAHDMNGLVLRARRAGLRTALLSNSWGNTYPRQGWDDMFDVVVISGEVGMRKPEAQIFHHTLDLLGVTAGQAVFVDDLGVNVRAAVAVGMVGVHHTAYDTTAAELEAIFGLVLAEG